MRRIAPVLTLLAATTLAVAGCGSTEATSAEPAAPATTQSSATPTATASGDTPSATASPEDPFATDAELADAFNEMFGDAGPSPDSSVGTINAHLIKAKIRNIKAQSFTYQPLEVCLLHDSGTRLIASLPADYSTITLRFTDGSCKGTGHDSVVTVETSGFTITHVKGSGAFETWARGYLT